MTRTVDLRQLRTQAKELRRALARRDPAALVLLTAQHPAPTDPPTLRDAQLVIAREQGHASWHDLVHAVGTRVVVERDLHRWFAVELNNETWDDLERLDGDAPSTEGEHLLYGAYAAAYHLVEAGTMIHHARAEHLLARVAVAVGRPDLALAHARRCAELLAAAGQEATDADAAFAAEALARALAATGAPQARAALDEARRRAAAVADPADREVVSRELARGPWFGLSDR
jgi:hypothetical protein